MRLGRLSSSGEMTDSTQVNQLFLAYQPLSILVQLIWIWILILWDPIKTLFLSKSKLAFLSIKSMCLLSQTVLTVFNSNFPKKIPVRFICEFSGPGNFSTSLYKALIWIFFLLLTGPHVRCDWWADQNFAALTLQGTCVVNSSFSPQVQNCPALILRSKRMENMSFP